MKPFHPEELERRINAVRRNLPHWGIDALLVLQPENRRWLSGFTGSAGRLLVGADNASLATDFRYWEQARTQAPHFALFEDDRSSAALARWLREFGCKRIGLNSGHVTLDHFADLQAVPGIDWQALDAPLAPLRAVKSAAEVERIASAARLVDAIVDRIEQYLTPGATEKQVAWTLEREIRDAGADGVAFDIIVASGPHAAFPHHRPSERPLQPGDPVVVDLGANIDGYRSDLTRTFLLDSADDRFQEIYSLVHSAQRAALTALRPGQSGREADGFARDAIAAGGYGDNFGHGLGHGIGLEVHEAPSLSPRATEQPLASGMVFTVEPGIYIPGWGGVRIEDLVLLTESGVRLLSHARYNPFIG